MHHHPIRLREIDRAPMAHHALQPAVLRHLLLLVLLPFLSLLLVKNVVAHHESLLARSRSELLDALFEDNHCEEAELRILMDELRGERHYVLGHLHVRPGELLVRVLGYNHQQRRHVLGLEVVILCYDVVERTHHQIALSLALVLLDGGFQRRHLDHLGLEVVLEAADALTNTLSKLAQRRLHLELGLIPLPSADVRADRDSIDVKLSTARNAAIPFELVQLLEELERRRFCEHVHLAEVVAK
mmetsp:Transcript_53762/g.123681  ORF Transcript_53762/g.123681 Transcript_53762/m.123681 type:complete len:243 (+) Transcript_53762:1122-1850(+)